MWGKEVSYFMWLISIINEEAMLLLMMSASLHSSQEKLIVLLAKAIPTAIQ